MEVVVEAAAVEEADVVVGNRRKHPLVKSQSRLNHRPPRSWAAEEEAAAGDSAAGAGDRACLRASTT